AACLRSPWLGWDGRGPTAGFPYGEVEDYIRAPSPPPTVTPTPTAIRRRPPLTATVTPTRTYGRVPYTPTPTPTATRYLPPPIIVRISSTPTPTGTPTATPPSTAEGVITGVSGIGYYMPANNTVAFCIQINTSILDGVIFDLEWLGEPWQRALPGNGSESVPPGWSWQPV